MGLVGAEALAKGVEIICLNPTAAAAYADGMATFAAQGFDGVRRAGAQVASVISDAARYLAPRGVMNVFAGVGRGTLAELDLSDVYLKDARVIGHSASTIDDLRVMLRRDEVGRALDQTARSPRSARSTPPGTA